VAAAIGLSASICHTKTMDNNLILFSSWCEKYSGIQGVCEYTTVKALDVLSGVNSCCNIKHEPLADQLDGTDLLGMYLYVVGFE